MAVDEASDNHCQSRRGDLTHVVPARFPSAQKKKENQAGYISLHSVYCGTAREGDAVDHSRRLKGFDLQPCQGDKEDFGRGDAF